MKSGTYKFYVVANYVAEKDDQSKEDVSKEDVIFKCKSDLITLRIIDESNTNITNQNTYLKTDVKLNDETADEKQRRLVDLVKNTNFSLNYEEISTGSEIKTNWFQFCYTYHPLNISEKRVFQINNKSADDNDRSVFNTITNEINANGGVTDRTSNELYSNVQTDYEKIKNDYTFDSLIKNLESWKEYNNYFIVIAGIVAAILFILLISVSAIFAYKWKSKNWNSDASFTKKITYLILGAVGLIAIIGLAIITYMNINEQISNLSDSLKDIKNNATSNYALVKNIKDDEQYFEGDDAQVKWNNGGNTIWRSKKYYYQGGYRESKGKDASDKEIPSDCDEYLGGKDNAENIRNKAKKLFWVFLGVAVGLIICCVIILYFINCVIREFKDINQDNLAIYLGEENSSDDGEHEIHEIQELRNVLLRGD